jgi:hypothetical protein
MPGPWLWDDLSKRYHDRGTGRYLGNREMLTLRDTFTEAIKGDVDKLTRQLAERKITLGRWTLDMQGMLKETYKTQYGLAVGGRHNMTPSDFGRVGSMIKRQYGYLYDFAEDIRAQKLSAGQIKTRARMYVSSSTQAYGL